jgi:hypothetical protein
MVDFDEIVRRISVRDILDDAGLHPERNRMACPIHDGTNPTSFSYSDATFICHSCGANGGLLALTEYLHECSKQEALKKLHDLAGLPFDLDGNGKDRSAAPFVPRRRLQVNPDYSEAANRLEWLELYKYGLEAALRIIRRKVKQGDSRLEEFYAKEQQYLHQLEELDLVIISMNYEVNELKRGGTSNDKHSTARDQ